MNRVFLLSPPNCAGIRARGLLEERSRSEVAVRLGSREGIPLGVVAAFLSSLYFRGKLAYAVHFGRSPEGVSSAMVITPNRGLVPAETPVTLRDLRGYAGVAIDLAEPRYTEPLTASASALRETCGKGCEMVLLGSIATGKYVDCLLPIFGERLLFPAEFVGRGDMSRGGLMLRRVASDEELCYIPVRDAVRKGKRPTKLGKP